MSRNHGKNAHRHETISTLFWRSLMHDTSSVNASAIEGASIHDFRSLRLWQVAMELASSVLLETKSFPPQQTMLLTSQMQRSALSVPSNIAEGFSLGSKAQFCKYLRIAKGSLSELETQLIMSTMVGFMEESRSTELQLTCRRLRTMISKFIAAKR